MLHHGARRTIQHKVFALARRDGETVHTGGAHQVIGTQARRNDGPAGAKGAAVGDHARHGGALPQEASDGGLQAQLDTVGDGVLRGRKAQRKGIDDAPRGRIERAGGRLCEAWLTPAHLLRGEQFQAGDAIFSTAVIEFPQRGEVLLADAHHIRAATLKLDIQLTADLVEQGIARHVQTGFGAPRLGVIAGVDDGRVGLGGALAHVRGPVHEEDAQAIARELARNVGAHHASADDDHIIERSIVHQGCCSSSCSQPRVRETAFFHAA